MPWAICLPCPSICRVGDASRLDDLPPLAAVVSCFGLQQMPQPAQVLAHWTRALSPGRLPACGELAGWGADGLAGLCLLCWAAPL